MAVIKADAYGHGAVPVAQCLAACGVDWFGVATVEEALELRAAGIEQPILLLGGLYMSDPAHLVEYPLDADASLPPRGSIPTPSARGAIGKPIEFHLKVDTGMGRLGLPLDRLEAFLQHYREMRGLRVDRVLHAPRLGGGSGRHADRRTGGALPGGARGLCARQGFEPEWTHVSNSAALLARSRNSPRTWCAWARCSSATACRLVPHRGAKRAQGEPFEPVLTFKSRVVYLKDVPTGTPLGYGAAFHTRRPSRIATVPVGYADGLSRALSNRGRAIVRDRYARIVGNISMDLTLLDVTDIPGVDVGDEVILLGATRATARSPRSRSRGNRNRSLRSSLLHRQTRPAALRGLSGRRETQPIPPIYSLQSHGKGISRRTSSARF